MKKIDLKLMNKYNKHPILNLGAGITQGDVLVDFYKSPKVLKIDLDKSFKIKGKFKTIYCFGTIHYLINQEDFLINIKKCLDKEGILIIGTNIDMECALDWTAKHNTPSIYHSLGRELLEKHFKIIKTKKFRFKWIYYVCRLK